MLSIEMFSLMMISRKKEKNATQRGPKPQQLFTLRNEYTGRSNFYWFPRTLQMKLFLFITIIWYMQTSYSIVSMSWQTLNALL